MLNQCTSCQGILCPSDIFLIMNVRHHTSVATPSQCGSCLRRRVRPEFGVSAYHSVDLLDPNDRKDCDIVRVPFDPSRRRC